MDHEAASDFGLFKPVSVVFFGPGTIAGLADFEGFPDAPFGFAPDFDASFVGAFVAEKLILPAPFVFALFELGEVTFKTGGTALMMWPFVLAFPFAETPFFCSLPFFCSDNSTGATRMGTVGVTTIRFGVDTPFDPLTPFTDGPLTLVAGCVSSFSNSTSLTAEFSGDGSGFLTTSGFETSTLTTFADGVARLGSSGLLFKASLGMAAGSVGEGCSSPLLRAGGGEILLVLSS
ncbi:MAG: hypothetical protein ABJ349_13920, partial [Hyphomicrobiales bacterium]